MHSFGEEGAHQPPPDDGNAALAGATVSLRGRRRSHPPDKGCLGPCGGGAVVACTLQASPFSDFDLDGRGFGAVVAVDRFDGPHEWPVLDLRVSNLSTKKSPISSA